MKDKLVVVIMGQNCEKFLSMCLESVKDADAIVYCDGGSTDNTLHLVNKFNYRGFAPFVISQNYDQEDKAMNGKQRNFYLKHVKEEYPSFWCLVLDADEVVEDLSKIKEFIQTAKPTAYSVHMRHFHNDLGHEDATVEKHFVYNRLFKISEADSYPEVEHPVLRCKSPPDLTDCTTIWHLAHINHCFNIKGRYEKNMKHSNVHTPEFLEEWKDHHMFGTYPSKPVNPTDIPEVILNYFHINKDKYYFANRGIELKHPICVKQWNDYFKPESVLDLGCGRGPYLFFWKWFVNDVRGFELSGWATTNAFVQGIAMTDISNEIGYQVECEDFNRTGWDLITAIDVLEHLTDEQLDKTLSNMVKYGKKFLFSIPFVGDPNLNNDKTHKQFRTKEEWIKLIEGHGIKINETPSDWAFAHQILVGEIFK